jgi:hypothetical protein
MLHVCHTNGNIVKLTWMIFKFLVVPEARLTHKENKNSFIVLCIIIIFNEVVTRNNISERGNNVLSNLFFLMLHKASKKSYRGMQSWVGRFR